ncbi:MAG: heme-copper oxidase subunit III [Myxococcota bacterium]
MSNSNSEPSRPALSVVDGGMDSGPEAISSRQLGLWIFLVSLGVLFAATVVAYLIVRFRNDGWSQGLPSLPRGLLINTASLLVTSAALWQALRAVQRDDARRLVMSLWVAFGFAIVFLVGQILNWVQMIRADMPPNLANLYAFTFYMLTGTHAAHVLGGFVPLVITLKRAQSGRYNSSSYEGVQLTARYWHFLDIVWLILLAVMSI